MLSLRWTSILLLATSSLSARAIGLGPLQLDSALGQPFRASFAVMEPGRNTIAESCLKARIDSADGAFITNAQISVSNVDGRPMVTVESRQHINEPAVAVLVNLDCGARVRRSYQVLLDFPSVPSTMAAVQSVTTPVTLVSKLDSTLSDVQASAKGRPTRANERRRAGVQPSADGNESNVQPSSRMLARANSPSNESRASRAVLRMSSTDLPISDRLKMSEILSPLPAEGEPAKSASQEMRLAYNQFAAVLRDEDPLVLAAMEITAAQKKASRLELEKAALKTEKDVANLAYENLNRKSFSAIWVAALSGLLLFSLGTIAWLAGRLKQVNQKAPKWWESFNVLADDAPGQTTGDRPSARAVPSDVAAGHSGNVTPFSRSGQLRRNEPVFETDSGSNRAAQGMEVPFAALETPASRLHSLSGSESQSGAPVSEPIRNLNVEEVSDIVQEAEFWMLLNDPQRALALLEPHAEIERPDSPVTWLYMIDLYRQTGCREKYQALGDRFKRLFNARIPAWDEESPGEKTTLEDFPVLIKKICDLWDDQDQVIPFLESLLIDDREGGRVGFDLPVYKEIILLIGVANECMRDKMY